jgi:hypothetical protein
MKVKLFLLLATLFVGYIEFIHGASIETILYPQYVDGRTDSNPFAVFVRITGWTGALNREDVAVKVTPISGENYHIWNGSAWGSAYSWGNCPSIKDELDNSGNWEGWIFLKSRGADDAGVVKPFKASATYKTASGWSSEGKITEITSHAVTYLKTTGDNLIAVCYAKADSPAAGKVVAAYANENDSPPSQQPLGIYVVEDNGISEDVSSDPAYPSSPETGYFRLALPRNTTIEKFVTYERIDNNYNEEPEIFDVDTKTEKGYYWETGSSKTKDLEEGDARDISLPVILSSCSVTRKGNRVIIRWSTESEVDIIGWNVYRRSGDRWIRLNRKLISSKGEFGGSYEFLDRRSTTASCLYSLEWVNFDGSRERSKPIKLKPSQRLKASLWAKVKAK